MAKEHSFDITAQLNMQELKNAILQAKKELETRYDFKGLAREIELNEKEKKIILTSSSESKCDAMLEILLSKAIKRGISPKALKLEKMEDASGGNRRAVIKIIDTIGTEEAKSIVKEIKAAGFKVQTSIQGDTVRVIGKSLDELQAVIAHLKQKDLEIPLSFGNYR